MWGPPFDNCLFGWDSIVLPRIRTRGCFVHAYRVNQSSRSQLKQNIRYIPDYRYLCTLTVLDAYAWRTKNIDILGFSKVRRRKPTDLRNRWVTERKRVHILFINAREWARKLLNMSGWKVFFRLADVANVCWKDVTLDGKASSTRRWLPPKTEKNFKLLINQWNDHVVL